MTTPAVLMLILDFDDLLILKSSRCLLLTKLLETKKRKIVPLLDSQVTPLCCI